PTPPLSASSCSAGASKRTHRRAEHRLTKATARGPRLRTHCGAARFALLAVRTCARPVRHTPHRARMDDSAAAGLAARRAAASGTPLFGVGLTGFAGAAGLARLGGTGRLLAAAAGHALPFLRTPSGVARVAAVVGVLAALFSHRGAPCLGSQKRNGGATAMPVPLAERRAPRPDPSTARASCKTCPRAHGAAARSRPSHALLHAWQHARGRARVVVARHTSARSLTASADRHLRRTD